jgi:hypothetical protein
MDIGISYSSDGEAKFHPAVETTTDNHPSDILSTFEIEQKPFAAAIEVIRNTTLRLLRLVTNHTLAPRNDCVDKWLCAPSRGEAAF